MKVQVFDVLGMDLVFISGGFWRPVAHFSLFSEGPERCWNFDGFSMSDVGPERSRHGGQGGSEGGSEGGQGDNRGPNFPSRTLP